MRTPKRRGQSSFSAGLPADGGLPDLPGAARRSSLASKVL